MVRYAFDVVLLPPEDITNLALDINSRLVKKHERKIVLDRNYCLPHISLAMGVIEDSDLEKARRILKDIAVSFSPLELTIKSMPLETLPNGKKVSFFEIEKTQELQALHNQVMEKLAPYVSYDATLADMYQDPRPEEISLTWINGFRDNSSFNRFSPHTTLGVGETYSPKMPIIFTASRLAICHLGNYCTCRKIIAESELSSK